MSEDNRPNDANSEDKPDLSDQNLPEDHLSAGDSSAGESSDEGLSDEESSGLFTDGVRFDGRTILFDPAGITRAEKPDFNADKSDFNEPDITESAAPESDDWPILPVLKAEEPESDQAFLKLFDHSEEEEEKRFERGFQTLFGSEEEHNSDDFPAKAAAIGDDSDELPDNEDDFIQREESEALQENIDALNRSEDAESLFILGSKYDPDDDVNMPDDETAQRSPVSILEAMLFVGDRENRPLELSKAVDLMRNVSIEEAQSAIEELNRRYEMRQSPYRIKEFGENAYKMVLTSAADSVRERFGAKVREVRLSQKAIDVLAVVAYRQPVTLAEIQTERPNAGGILSQLVKRELVITEMKTVDKKPVAYYRTGERFLKVLGIESLDELPMVDEIDYR